VEWIEVVDRVAKRATRKWWTFVKNYKDEVESEALVAVAKAIKFYRLEDANAWEWYMDNYAYGCLLSRLRAERYLPTAAPTIWTCTMHPEIRMPAPGRCPKCNMDLTINNFISSKTNVKEFVFDRPDPEDRFEIVDMIDELEHKSRTPKTEEAMTILQRRKLA